MKLSLTVLLFVCSVILGRGDEKVDVPKGVKYKTASRQIPFQAIEEPVFVIETKDAKIFVQLTAKLKLLWIDDYQNVSFEKEKQQKKS